MILLTRKLLLKESLINFISSKGWCLLIKGKQHHFPIQKFAKIFPSKSSEEISPVIVPK